MYWDPYNKLHMAFSRTTKADGLLTLDNVEYSARLRIGKLDVATSGSETFDYIYEQRNWFGRSSSIAYIDNGENGSNVYVGGAQDPAHLYKSDPKEWSPAITLLKADGQVERTFRIKLGDNWEDDAGNDEDDRYSYIDHLAKSYSGPLFIFGTTRSADPSKPGIRLNYFRVALDSNN